MNEEEKKLVEKFENLYIKDFNGEPITVDDRLSYIECALITNLIEELDKELNSLKKIEQLHQEENGKLRVELEQEKEKNEIKDIIIKNYQVIATKPENYIHKDKIRELLEKYDKDIAWDSADDHYYFTKFIQELLEENNEKQM